MAVASAYSLPTVASYRVSSAWRSPWRMSLTSSASSSSAGAAGPASASNMRDVLRGVEVSGFPLRAGSGGGCGAIHGYGGLLASIIAPVMPATKKLIQPNAQNDYKV